jgi:DNA helicase II / ATP-dependent DNA helicase PcrA
MPWNDGLGTNSPAYGIAVADARFIRVVAGPGTGKTFALKRRVARLLEQDADPTRILPVTFTNVAAEDLQREMLQVGVPGCERIRGSTLHSLCMRILARQNVFEAIGRTPRPLNRFEMEPLLYDLPPRFGNKRARAKRVRAYEAAWARLQHQAPGHALSAGDRAFEQTLIGWLQFHQGMLIGEIIPHVYRYLRDNPAAPERNLYDYILVDEYQDLNRAEQAVIELLTGDGELCIVGDDDQSLYSFKFAHPAGIREFPHTHEDTDDHQLLQCRRCPTRVVEIANSLISHNQDRDPRRLAPRAENGEGRIMIIQYESIANEAAGIAEFIENLITNRGYRPQEILVLAQRRSIGNPIHDALTGRNIPSKSYYQEGVLDSANAQERMATLKLFLDPRDRIALRWLLGFGSNDFRAGAYARIRRECEDTGVSPWDLMSQLAAGELNIAHTHHLTARFRQLQAELARLADELDIQDFVAHWLGELNVDDPFHQLVLDLSLGVDAPGELLDALIQAVSQPDIPPDIAEVRIMSLHKSKGLSSPVVIIAGCVEGLLPAFDPELTPAEQQAALEEQRRLFFVGLTRVKADPTENRPGVLMLTSSLSMSLADAMQSGIRPTRVDYGTAYVHASRFIQELGPAAPPRRSG